MARAEGTAGRSAAVSTGSMGGGAAPIPRARGVGEILDTALDVQVASFGTFLWVAALCWTPFYLAGEWVLAVSEPGWTQVLWALSARAPEVLTTGFVCGLVGERLLGRGGSTSDALWNGARAAAGLSAIALLQVVAGALLTCLCVLPMVLSFWLFSAAPTVYVLEREALVREARVGGSLAAWGSGVVLSVLRGARLVLGLASFGRWVGFALVASLAMLWPLRMLPALMQNGLVRPVIEDLTGLRGHGVGAILAAVGALFVGIATAYSAVLGTVYYVDQRVRREGLDLELRLAERERAWGSCNPGAGPARGRG